MGEGLVTMQQMVEAMILEVHITNKIFVPSPALKTKVDITSTSLLSSPLLSSPSAPPAAEAKRNDDHLELFTSPEKSSEVKECLATPSKSGGIKKECSTSTSVSNETLSSPVESEEVQTTISSLDASGETSSSPSEQSSSPGQCGKGLSSSSGENGKGTDALPSPPRENGKVKLSSGDLGDVKEEKLPVSQVDEEDTDLLRSFSHLAPCVPVVELYSQVGAQVLHLH